MHTTKYRNILLFIGAVIFFTLGIQFYWNYKNYKESKRQFINEVQISLDNAVDHYFIKLVSEKTIPFLKSDSIDTNRKMDTQINYSTLHIDSLISRGLLDSNNVHFNFKSVESSTIINIGDQKNVPLNVPKSKQLSIDSFSISIINDLSSKILSSINEDTFSLIRLDSIFTQELNRKGIQITYGLSHSQENQDTEYIRPDISNNSEMSSQSISPFFFRENKLKVHFNNLTLVILKKNLFGILLSFLLILSVIACLFYLLYIIRDQKHIAELKNDFINNTTHEFKTPISTISVALEAMQDASTDKRKQYTHLANEQLEKLNAMVEKILETATLGKMALAITHESINLVAFLKNISTHENLLLGNKPISFSSSVDSLEYHVDIFHFGNAITNIVDNAVKYGGDKITIKLVKSDDAISIIISDTGNSLNNEHKKHIFEKFYRIPTGNVHNIKGYGIGLYYTKTIIEQHGGSISLITKPNTSFIISLPHE